MKRDNSTDNGPYAAKAMSSIYYSGGGTLYASNGAYLFSSIQEQPWYLWKALSGVSVIGEGPRTIFMIGNGIRDKHVGFLFLYNNTSVLNRCRYAHFSIDWNGANNPVLATYSSNWAGIVNRMGAGWGGTDNIYEDITFLHSAGHHFLWFDGPTPTTGVQNTKVLNCRFYESGDAIPGNHTVDHSSIYMGGDNNLISGCTFRNHTAVTVGTAIEFHGSNNIAIGNTIDKYLMGFNIGADERDNYNTVLTGNIVNDSPGFADFWNTGSYEFQNQKIIGNIARIREVNGYPAIRATINHMSGSKNGKGLTIEDNDFSMMTTSCTTCSEEFVNNQRFDELLLNNNRVTGFGQEILYVMTAAGHPLSGITVSNNKTVNTGWTATAGNKRGLVFNSYTGASIDNIVIHGNLFDFTASSVSYGIEFILNRYPHVNIFDNVILGATSKDIYKYGGTLKPGDVFLIKHKGYQHPRTISLPATLGSVWALLPGNRIFYAIDPTNDGTPSVWRSTEFLSSAPSGTSGYINGDNWRNYGGSGGGTLSGGTWGAY
jgi:hypothetical protein